MSYEKEASPKERLPKDLQFQVLDYFKRVKRSHKLKDKLVDADPYRKIEIRFGRYEYALYKDDNFISVECSVLGDYDICTHSLVFFVSVGHAGQDGIGY